MVVLSVQVKVGDRKESQANVAHLGRNVNENHYQSSYRALPAFSSALLGVK
jgi:hypothetical protein